MNTIASKALGSAGASVRALNPHLFSTAAAHNAPQVGHYEHRQLPPKCKTLVEVFAAEAGKRVRQSAKPLLNKLETEFWNEYLALRYERAKPQAVKFRLGNGIVYTPDFVDLSVQPVKAWEVKGPKAFRGGFENLKVAASLYPEVKWVLVWKENGVWKRQEILP